MTEQSFMDRFGPALVANGYAILPILPGSKKPGQVRKGRWCDYPDWTRHAHRETTEHELAIWRQWPDAGVGVVCGRVVALDIDIAEDDVARAVEALARERLGDTPAIRIGRAPKRLLAYRTEAPFAGIRRAPVEILGLGQQFVAHAIHPDTGQPYVWPEEPLADLDIGALPEITEEQARAFLDEALALVPERLKPARLAANGKQVAQNPHHRLEGTTEAIRAALAFLPNADLAWDDWVRIGLAMKGALGDTGAALFAAWSAQSGKDDPAFTARIWDGLKPERIGAGTIYHLAMERGWKPDPALVLDGAAPKEETHPAAAMLAALEVREDASTLPPPSDEPDPPIPDGLLRDLVEYIVATARRPQPRLALGASLCAIGALMGRRYRTTSNLRSNLYIVGIADSGSGKNHAREVINELFIEAGLIEHLGGNKIASGAGLLSALHRQPALLMQIDEFGMFLSAAADRKRSPRHITEILDNMTELYTAAGGMFLGAEYSNRDGRNERRDIDQPCLSVYGTTTPVHFWGALQAANVVDGSLARFIIVETEEDYPAEVDVPGIRTAPPALVDGLKRIAEGGPADGNIAGLGAGLSTRAEPMTVPMTPEGRAAFAALGGDLTERLREARGTASTAILARIAENAAKLALIAGVSRDPQAPRIEERDAVWAIRFVRQRAERTLLAIERHVADNEIERNHKRLLEIVREAGANGLTKSELTRRTQFVDRRTRDELIVSLTESGQIASRMRASATRQAMVYVAAGGVAP